MNSCRIEANTFTSPCAQGQRAFSGMNVLFRSPQFYFTAFPDLGFCSIPPFTKYIIGAARLSVLHQAPVTERARRRSVCVPRHPYFRLRLPPAREIWGHLSVGVHPIDGGPVPCATTEWQGAKAPCRDNPSNSLRAHVPCAAAALRCAKARRGALPSQPSCEHGVRRGGAAGCQDISLR